jgi:hypothetical protein
MTISPGSRLGPYEILSPLVAGSKSFHLLGGAKVLHLSQPSPEKVSTGNSVGSQFRKAALACELLSLTVAG